MNATLPQAKTTVIYDEKDPNGEGVTHVAIQTEARIPYVWATYSVRDRTELPALGTDMLVVPKETAKRMFDFKKGNIENLVN